MLSRRRGAVQVGALSVPLYAKATKLGMRELVCRPRRRGHQWHGDHDSIVHCEAARHGFALPASLRARHTPYRTDMEFSKKVLAK
jgi:hypothetical protein